ncbi:hypothetical protein XarjCFBP7653_06585 [Xanthomonas arboricola]|nr:hypothetical protein XarjCFBP7653_06585 [Xanthomonas arboricola]
MLHAEMVPGSIGAIRRARRGTGSAIYIWPARVGQPSPGVQDLHSERSCFFLQRAAVHRLAWLYVLAR